MVPRNEYPRPNFVRKDWLNLNGEWDFAFDDNKVGFKEKWFLKHDFDKRIIVPFAFQTKLSGINDKMFHDDVWYRKTFKVPAAWKNNRIHLNFGAVDFECIVYVNGCFVKSHIGGNTPFYADITDFLTYKEEEIVVYVNDPSTDVYIPRGKQYWLEQEESIYYHRTTGIWQTIWLEPVEESYVESLMIDTDIDTKKVNLRMYLYKAENKKVLVEIKDKNKVLIKNTFDKFDQNFKTCFSLNIDDFEKKLWSPENPYLFDISISLMDNKNNVIDNVDSYFGFRKISTKDGKLYLNNKPYYQKLVLDQGYWRDSLLTAPTDEDFIKDINITKTMGFNGVRKHQKCEDPRFLYHADKIGLLVWGEISNSLDYSDKTVKYMSDEWCAIIERDYSHPSIVAWVPLNESWGVRQIAFDKFQQSHSLGLYNLIHSLDQTRLVISNDGWEHTISDICTIHNYNHGNKDEVEKYNNFVNDVSTKEKLIASRPAQKGIYANGYAYNGVPIVLSEFGGISFGNEEKGWGYTSCNKKEDLIDDLSRVFAALEKSSGLAGYCYTQLTDVEQEINGLVDYDRNSKVDLKIIKEIVDRIR